MNRQDVANLALRITGLYAIIEALPQLAAIFWTVQSFVQYGGMTSGPAAPSWLLMVGAATLPALILTILGLVLLLTAPALARKIFPTTEHTGDPVRILGMHAFAYSIVGLFVAARGLASLAGCVVLFDRQYSTSWITVTRTLAPPVVQLALGLALFFGAHGLVRVWTRLRYTGLRDKLGFCLHCGYDLTGNTTGICPECGTQTGHPPDAVI